MKASLLGLDPTRYESHALHRGERIWIETNCYVDLWIEVISAFGLDPAAALGFTSALDFEGDQWLFFKQATADLYDLYGIDVQELNIWNNLLDHAVEQVSRGRLVMVEVDAFHLPDTAGVSYRLAHTKTTIGIESIDTEARTLGYFHNAGYFRLGAQDFAALFGCDREKRPDELHPYTEFAKFHPDRALHGDALTARSIELLQKHLARRPRSNPISVFRASFEKDLAWLASQPQELFHHYAFSTLRQCGSSFELLGSYAKWLGGRGEAGLERIVAAADNLAGHAKTIQFKAARVVVLKRPVDFAPMLDAMEAAWALVTDGLDIRYRK